MIRIGSGRRVVNVSDGSNVMNSALHGVAFSAVQTGRRLR